MLTGFGMFWGAEGAGAHWPGSDASLLVLIPVIGLAAVGLVAWLRRPAAGGRSQPQAETATQMAGSTGSTASGEVR
jgi:uncharacterized membrane protein